MDRNDYYGGECASVNLQQLFGKFRNGAAPPATLGASREYNVDLVPKFLLSTGNLVKTLVHTKVTRYLEFQKCKGAFVVKKNKIQKVPATEGETLSTPLMGFFEKNKLRKLLLFIINYDPAVPKTHEGLVVERDTMRAVFRKFGLEAESCDFIGHAMALYYNDAYLDQPAKPTLDRIKLYCESLAAHGDSSFIYPKYGLGELPQGFARLSAIYGGTYMLRKPIEEIMYNEQGQAVGVRSEGEVARCKFILADPSYFPSRVHQVGNCVRCICVLNHSIPNTKDADSAMVIIPQNQCNPPRQNDVYVSVLSSVHAVCPKGKYLAFVSTTAETSDPTHELDSALRLLEPIEERFVYVTPMFVPNEPGTASKVFISKSYDSSSHFESTTDDVFRLYREITGQDLDLTVEVRQPEDGATATATATGPAAAAAAPAAPAPPAVPTLLEREPTAEELAAMQQQQSPAANE
eukprot:GAFH01001617.1.p2 GENE.GAFH01001617.1~~GAFH01001617.1.p2  ORF type:complete len:500 (-),score=184.12 GAFH01001617.1:21-1409(-)